MRNLMIWAISSFSCAVIFYDVSNLYSSVMQGVMMLVINSELRLKDLHGGNYLTAMIFEIVLSALSMVIYYLRPVYCVIFWIYFSAVNRFAVEDPLIFSVYGRYSIYLGYACSAVLLGVYSQIKHEVLFRYGSLWIFVNMSIIGFTWIYKYRMQGIDLLRFGIICIICISSCISMIENSLYIIIPGAIGSFFLLMYESFFYFIHFRRLD